MRAPGRSRAVWRPGWCSRSGHHDRLSRGGPPMARIVLPVMPFAGHVTPMLAVAAELVRRRHEVVAYTGAKYAPRFTAVGTGWEPWRQAPDFDEAHLAATFPQVGDGRGMRAGRANGEHVVLRTGVGQTRDLEALLARRPADAIVSDQMSVGGDRKS